jgi:polyribonucleotide nucleotidyltransferase
MISDLTAVPELGKTYLGKVVRLAEFGAFVELFPGTDGLLHISEIAEHRVKEVKDELNEGDQILVKVLAIEGNRIKLSRKSLLREQREKLGIAAPSASGGDDDFVAAPRSSRPERPHVPHEDRQPSSNASTILIEGGDDFEDGDDDLPEGDEPNFNRADGVPVPAGAAGGGAGGPAGAANKNRRRRRGRGRGPGGGPGGGANRGPR